MWKLGVKRASDLGWKMKNFVGYRTVDLWDEKRSVKFPMKILYPTKTPEKTEKFGSYDLSVSMDAVVSEGVYHLVLISHGTGGTPMAYRTLAHYLASHGYIVGLPEHPFNNRNDNSLEGTVRNLIDRPRHIQLVIDWFFDGGKFKKYCQPDAVALIGHSIGGYTALAVAGGMPSSLPSESTDGQQHLIPVVPDKRIKALVLLAPAAIWFQADGALSKVNCPILMLVGEKDEFTGPACPILMRSEGKDNCATIGYHAHLIMEGVSEDIDIQHRVVKNAGHFSFLSPFPDSMKNAKFPPSQDPPGFDRGSFQNELNAEVLNFLSDQMQ